MINIFFIFMFVLMLYGKQLVFFRTSALSARWPRVASCCVFRSRRQPDLQLRLRRPVRQAFLPATASSHVQALLCVSGQVLGLPLRRQRLWGLQGKTPGLWSDSPSQKKITGGRSHKMPFVHGTPCECVSCTERGNASRAKNECTELNSSSSFLKRNQRFYWDLIIWIHKI